MKRRIFIFHFSFSITPYPYAIELSFHSSAGVYGVEMRQSYNSTTYSDEGYLFLLIDFSERDPLIYVRAWQPNEWNDSALVRTANFRIYK